MSIDIGPPDNWTPVRFIWQGNQPAVEWCQLGRRRWAEPFFAQTADSARGAGCPLRLTNVDALDRWADAVPDLPLTGLIFHLSRCGSTLVSRMLAALPSNRVLSEPEMLRDALDRTAGPDDGRRVAWLRGLVHACATRCHPEEARTVIKLDPWLMLEWETIRAAFPGVPAAFVYRDPVEVLVSLRDGLASTFVPAPAGAERLGLTYVEALSVSTEEYCARALGRIATAAADAAGPALRLVNYVQLPDAVETEIAPFFGMSLDGAARSSMRAVAPFHARARRQLIFQSDSARKQREADEELRTLSPQWVAEAYARLEVARKDQVP